ncbi:MAG: alanine--tRNA ligase, partial [Gammaproteobacteria bacterium]|nr:alanine--tRNA ligase [Gammaproteobacteria bacterium]
SYFKKHEHHLVDSSPLVPGNDPTLLFTNAGMVQFKETFLGTEPRSYSRAVSSQRCVRAGGKHNDLDNVGYTARHHTFFEMLGNFSFGDYFKREAIQFAWQFLTEELALPKEKLWITVYQDDDEAADIWLNEIGIDTTRFSRCGEADNFWSMGDTGPCGPCSEIFYDHGADIPGGPPGSKDADLDRYIEIWNLVFMQYNRSAEGQLTPLPKPSVDTGMGLERIAAIMQGVHDNYGIDIFQYLIRAIAKLANSQDFSHKSLRVIADHIRSTSFLISDGVVPSNEGRGYVLRRIIRRAVRHGSKLGLHQPFFYRLVEPLAEQMGEAYPELINKRQQIENVLQQEEQQFALTLDNGLQVLEQQFAHLTNQTIPGELIFKLYDTYGFPVDLTGDIARERGLTLDVPGFEQAMQQQRQRSQKNQKFSIDYAQQLSIRHQTKFTGYDTLTDEASIIALFKNNQSVNTLQADDEGFVILDRTPFYAESGGQVGDKGLLGKADNLFQVEHTSTVGQASINHGKMKQGDISVGDTLQLQVNADERQATALNHSATHLLHAALRQLLGEHVQQKGSLVDATRLRFDFSHFEPLSSQQIQQIENVVNQKIRENIWVETNIMTVDEAKKSGAMALFNEKYGEHVRVLTIGDFSIELCGGTHVQRTGDIGLIKIIVETAIAAGVRRIEAISGQAALDYVNVSEQQLVRIAQWIKVGRDNLEQKIRQEIEDYRVLKKKYQQLKQKLTCANIDDLVSQAEQIGGSKVLLTLLSDVDVKASRQIVDQLKQKLTTAIIVIATQSDNKLSLIAGVTKNCTEKVKAGELVKLIAKHIDGQGGGRADMAQGGGSNVAKLPEAFTLARQWILERL